MGIGLCEFRHVKSEFRHAHVIIVQYSQVRLVSHLLIHHFGIYSLHLGYLSIQKIIPWVTNPQYFDDELSDDQIKCLLGE